MQVYNSPEVAAHYRTLQYLSAAEHLLFGRYIRCGDAILDLGVGGGRTTPYLSELASRYVGADYAEAMVLTCRNRFPNLCFVVADAANLSRFDDHMFDVVVMAFNGLDYVLPDSSRRRALVEIKRVLKPGGAFIFSSHNPRAVLQRPSWNPERIAQMARRITGVHGEQGPIFLLTKHILTVVRVGIALGQAVALSAIRSLQRSTKRAFWSGEGWIVDSAHGGLLTHYAVPSRVTDELADCGFDLMDIVGDDYPRTSRRLWTGWYYYVFVSHSESEPNACA